MMSIEKRIEKLEERTGAGKQVVITVRYEGDDTKPAEAQLEAAIAGCKARDDPGRKEGDFIVLYWKDGQYVQTAHAAPTSEGCAHVGVPQTSSGHLM